MDLVTPDIGLIFWTTVSFAILYFILAKFAWKPILGAVNEREKSIKDALSAAEKAKEEMVNLKADNEKILNEAKLQRESLLKEAREIKSKIIADAESEATEKANKLVEAAKTAIENEKSAAMKELQNTVVDLSLNIAEKLLSKELDNKEKQLENIQDILDKSKLNLFLRKFRYFQRDKENFKKFNLTLDINETKKIISKEISDLTNFNLKQSSDFTNKFFEVIKKNT